MPRKKINKAIQKSISLTEADWALIQKIGESVDKSNSAIIGDMLIAYMFLDSRILGFEETKEITSEFWEYYYKAVALRENRVIENMHEKDYVTFIQEWQPEKIISNKKETTEE